MTDAINADLMRLLMRLKPGQLLVPTLPERLVLARRGYWDCTALLRLLLVDEVQGRDRQALERHLQPASKTA